MDISISQPSSGNFQNLFGGGFGKVRFGLDPIPFGRQFEYIQVTVKPVKVKTLGRSPDRYVLTCLAKDVDLGTTYILNYNVQMSDGTANQICNRSLSRGANSWAGRRSLF